jgi:hypothetical protein
VHRERRFVEQLVRRPFDVVVDAVAPLVHDDFALARDLFVAKHQLRHPLGFELHREGDAIGGEALVIVRPVEPRAGVRLGAVLFEGAIELARLQPLGLVEHQVLEEVGEARLPRLLVARADLVPGEVAGDGRAAVDEEEDGEAIAEAIALHRFGTEGVRADELYFCIRCRRRSVQLIEPLHLRGLSPLP